MKSTPQSKGGKARADKLSDQERREIAKQAARARWGGSITVLEADPEQVTQLDSQTLVQLMKRLMLAECGLVNLPLRSVTVPLQITVPDGGEDGRVEWSGGIDETDYFPARLCAFQSKAQNLTATSVKAEIVINRKGGTPKLRDVVVEVLDRNGAYILFCSHAFTGQKIKKLRNAIASAIREAGGDPDALSEIEIYDANRISDWVNTHPSVALWLREQRRGRTLTGFLTHEGWSRAPEIDATPWIDDSETPRFSPVNLTVPSSERKIPNRNTWTFTQAADNSLELLATEKIALRIVGPSGFGKSRFAYEIFNRSADLRDEVGGAALIYTDLSIAGEEVPKLALEIADSGSPTILVVDECPDEMHSKLTALAQRVGSSLRLVTIDVETKFIQSKETVVISLEPASDEQIGEIARAVAPTINDSDSRFIEQLAQGCPRMAVLAAQQNGDGREAIQSATQVLDRIIWGKKPPDNEALKILELASLFEWIGCTDRVGNDAFLIATGLADVSVEAFIEHLLSFTSRGIITQKGDFVQVGPIPLAALIGTHRLSLLSDGTLFSFFQIAPRSLQSALLQRLRWLDTSPKAKVFARALLSVENIGNLDALNTDFGAECLNRLVHIDPDLAMATIDRVFGGLTKDELKRIVSGRRHLVWALEKLVFRRQSFDRAATLLRRLGAAETEERISNNASGQFKQLFQLYLSGTEAEPNARLLVLAQGLQSSDLKEQELCVAALEHMLTTHHFSRGGGAEEIGSGDRLEDWHPETVDDVQDFYRSALTFLTNLALSEHPFSERAKHSIGSNIRGLLNQLPLNELSAIISRIVDRFGFWPEAVQEVNEWLYYDREKAPENLGNEIREYFDRLMPTDPVELVVLYSSGWQTDFHDPDVSYTRENEEGHDFEYSLRKTSELAEIIAADSETVDRAISRLVSSDAKTIFPFARKLGELAPTPVDLFSDAVAKAESNSAPPNGQFFSGLVAGIDIRDPDMSRECVRVALNSPKFKDQAMMLIGAGRLQSRDIELVVSLLRSGDVKPWQCASLSYGRGMDHLAREDIVPFLDELAEQGADGLWAVLDIFSMLLHGGKKPAKRFLKQIKTVLVNPELLGKSNISTMDGHHLEVMFRLLDKHKAFDAEFSRAIVVQLFRICDREHQESFYSLQKPVLYALKILAVRHPKVLWGHVSQLLQSDDALVHFHLKKLIDPDHDDHLGAGPLYDLPSPLYMDWVRRDPEERARIVLEWLPIATEQEEGALAWHPTLEQYIDEFGRLDDVLNELAARLHPRSWRGPLETHLIPLLDLLDLWTTHPNFNLRAWAYKMTGDLTGQIEQERKRSEESSIRS